MSSCRATVSENQLPLATKQTIVSPASSSVNF